MRRAAGELDFDADAFGRRLAATMAIFASEVQFEFQGAPDQDWKGLRDNYERGFAKPGRSRWIPQWDQIIVSDSVAAAFSTWKGIVSKPDGTDEVRAENRGVDVLKRGENCRWQIVRSLTYPKTPKAAK